MDERERLFLQSLLISEFLDVNNGLEIDRQEAIKNLHEYGYLENYKLTEKGLKWCRNRVFAESLRK